MSAETIFTGDHATTIAGATSSASNSPQLPDMDGPLILVDSRIACRFYKLSGTTCFGCPGGTSGVRFPHDEYISALAQNVCAS
jgi:hypothetical protein